MMLPMKRGKPQNLLVDELFTIVINPKFKKARAKCKYCHKELDRNASRLQIHLDNCKPYFAAKQAGFSSGSSQSSIRLFE